MGINKKTIFNFLGKDDVAERRLVNGNTTNLMDITRVKYTWAKQIYKNMMENFWIPEKIDLNKDCLDYKKLSNELQTTLDKIISSLTFLDSIQVTNLPNISDFITAPEVNLVLSLHSFQEAVHSQSYSYLINSVIPKEKLDNYFNTWKETDILYERNKFLVNQFQIFVDKPTTENFLRSCLATYVLEGISFYMGFNFFYFVSLKKNLLFGVTDLIRYINRDEFTHIVLFQNIINTLVEEENISKDLYEKTVNEIFSFAVENEKKWMHEVLLGNKEINISLDTSDQYIEYITNLRLKEINCNPMFTKERNLKGNPLTYLESVSGLSQDALIKSNFFEQHVTSYNMSSAVDWGDF